MKHKHAELMMQYAQDAMETDKPWERWEIFIKDSWRDLGECFFFAKEEEYRRKPKMLSVTLANGEVVSWPEPVKELRSGDDYWYIGASGGAHFDSYQICDTENKIICMGVVHLTREAAEQHSHALFKINNQVAK
jgi:hypothetical protein